MVQIELTQEEAGMLRKILVTELGELRMEISNTGNHEFREELKKHEALLKKVLRALGWQES